MAAADIFRGDSLVDKKLRWRATNFPNKSLLLNEDKEEHTALMDEKAVEEDPSLPFGGKVYLARRKKPEHWFVLSMEILAVCFVLCFIYYSYYHFDNMHFHVTHFYAKLGQPHAMHMTGQRYLFGKGVNKDTDKAMEWFKYASDKGHAHAAHNLAVGHFKGYNTEVKNRDEAHKLLKFAAAEGVEEAINSMNKRCPNGEC